MPAREAAATGSVTTTAAKEWLDQIGLPQYRAAFEASGYDDWPQLTQLTDADLDSIACHARIAVLPGHRKKLLMASRQLAAVSTQLKLRHSLRQSFLSQQHHPSCLQAHQPGQSLAAAPTTVGVDRRSGLQQAVAVGPSLASHDGGLHGMYGPLANDLTMAALAAASDEPERRSHHINESEGAEPPSSPMAPRPVSARRRWNVQSSEDGIVGIDDGHVFRHAADALAASPSAQTLGAVSARQRSRRMMPQVYDVRPALHLTT